MSWGRFIWSGAWLLLVAFSPGSVAAQTGRVTGVVTDQTSGQPLVATEVYLNGTQIHATTDSDGRYLLPDVPAGTYSLVAERLGYSAFRQENVVVRGDETVTLDIAISVEPMRLEAIVATGLIDPTAGIKAPFVVEQLRGEYITAVPATHSALAALEGKVAGVTVQAGSGQPGSGVSILLRTPTSIQRSNDPLLVVDGAIITGSTMDLESMDIENIEIIKGAAASAAYGSKASGGVINITTARGRELAAGDRRISFRTEYGRSSVATDRIKLSNSHAFRVNDAGEYINSDGEVVSRGNRETDTNFIQDAPYIGQLYNNIDKFYRAGEFLTQNLSISQNLGETNFRLAVNRYREAGTLETNDGYQRYNFRVNLDHRFGEKLEVNTSLYHNRSRQDDTNGRPFWDLLLMPPDLNLDVRDENGDFVQVPDEEVPLENPIWRQAQEEVVDRRMRTIASVQARYNLTPWLSFRADAGYDRSNQTDENYEARGIPENSFDGIYTWAEPNDRSEGDLEYGENTRDYFNASISAHFLNRIGPLTLSSAVGAQMERDQELDFEASGSDFWVEGVKSVGIGQNENVSSGIEERRSTSYRAQTSLDYDGRYVLDLLVRREGSSVFGPGSRWHNYYRASGSYLMGREEWWPFPQIDEFKLRYSVGTSGGRPSFGDQYETWNVGSSGISKGTLGNRNLQPERSTEHEMGIDLVALQRYSLRLTYAMQRTEDQLIQVPLPSVTGYSVQWQNAGTIEGNTWELTFDANLLQTPTLRWNATVIADRSRSEITEFDRPCYFTGHRYRCAGESLSGLYTQVLHTSHDELPAVHAGSHDAFQVNDDGYLVPVGAGNSWRDGLAKNLWNTQIEIDGVTYNWGQPFYKLDENGSPARIEYGDMMPDFNLGFLNQVQWRGFNVHAHVHASVGGLIYSETRQRLYQHDRHADLDQAGKPDELKKPNGYYQAIYNRMNRSDHFVEDGSYVKLRELAVNYRFGRDLIDRIGLGGLGVQAFSLGITGRNLWTLTEYTGFDPEVGGLFTRTDSFGWPNGRTFTGVVNIEF